MVCGGGFDSFAVVCKIFSCVVKAWQRGAGVEGAFIGVCACAALRFVCVFQPGVRGVGDIRHFWGTFCLGSIRRCKCVFIRGFKHGSGVFVGFGFKQDVLGRNYAFGNFGDACRAWSGGDFDKCVRIFKEAKMRSKSLAIAVFTALICAQAGIFIFYFCQREYMLKNGDAYKMRVIPSTYGNNTLSISPYFPDVSKEFITEGLLGYLDKQKRSLGFPCWVAVGKGDDMFMQIKAVGIPEKGKDICAFYEVGGVKYPVVSGFRGYFNREKGTLLLSASKNFCVTGNTMKAFRKDLESIWKLKTQPERASVAHAEVVVGESKIWIKDVVVRGKSALELGRGGK